MNLARRGRIAAFLFLCLSAAAIGTLTEQIAGCSEQCPDDAPGGTCPPVCACSCCSHVQSFPSGAGDALLSPPPVTRFVSTSEQAAPSTPEPAEIAHVPKSRLA